MDELNKRILEMWSENQNDFNGKIRYKSKDIKIPFLWPSCYFNPPENVQILFIGLNPSDSFYGIKKLLPNNGGNALFENIRNNDFQTAMQYNRQEYTYQNIIALEELGSNNHKYFKKFKELGNFIINGDENDEKEESHFHIDLYQFRLRSSSKFMLIKENNVDFFNQQLEISIDLIKKLKPKLIFVANKNACDIILEKFDLTWNNSKGCHTYNENEWNCNIFLSGMITQTRAIDKYSFERLKWHLKSIYNGKIMSNKINSAQQCT